MIILFPRQIIPLVLTALVVVAALTGRLLAASVITEQPRGRVACPSLNLFPRDASPALIPDASGSPATITRHFPDGIGQGST